MRRRLTTVFAVVVVAFVALSVVVLLALRPQVSRSKAVGSRFAETARLVAMMRGDLQEMQAAAIAAHAAAERSALPAGAASPESAAELRERFEVAAASFDAAARLYASTAAHASDEGLWRAISLDAFPEFAREAQRAVLEPPAKASVRSVAAINRAAVRSDHLLQLLQETNAHALAVGGRDIHETVHALVYVCLLLSALGSLGGFLLVRWALAAVRDYERSTQERIEELDDFAGRVAHDLRNPLQAIGLSLSLIARRAAKDERTLATCATARESANRMSAFIQELLTFARSGAHPPAGVRARVEKVLGEVLEDLAPVARARGVELLVHPGSDAFAAISEEALRAIVANLTDNAIKHLGAGEGERRVDVTSRVTADGRVEIRVSDTGAGIAPDALSRIFDPFFRASDRPGGFGIGLRTVRRLVDAHGGQIRVESEVGRGSSFTVILPAAPRPDEGEHGAMHAPAPADGPAERPMRRAPHSTPKDPGDLSSTR